MAYTFDSRQRYKHVSSYRSLTSTVITTITIASVVLTAVIWALLMLVAPGSTSLLAFGVLAVGVSGALLNAAVFGRTYFPYAPPPRDVADIKQAEQNAQAANVAQAASFELIKAIGPVSPNQGEASLANSIEHLMEAESVRDLLYWLELDPALLYKALKDAVIPNLTWEKLSQYMITIAAGIKSRVVEPEHALGALLLRPSLQTFLRENDYTQEDIGFALWWGAESRRQRRYRKRWWDEDRMLAFTGVGLSWASGFTPLVDQFARLPEGSAWDDIIIGHETKVDELINTLARQRQSNVLLVADPGVGRVGIIRELRRRIQNNMAHPALNGQRVLYINAGELTALDAGQAGQLAVVTQALKEMERAGNVIAIIDGLSSILGAKGELRINVADLLVPFLSSATVRVLVMVSYEDYHLRLKSDQKIISYFEVVQVPSLSPQNTMQRVALTIPAVSRQSKLFIPYKSVRTLVQDTSSIMPHIPFPDRAFDFLEEAVVMAQSQQAKKLEPGYIHTLISRKVGVNFGDLRKAEKQRLLSLEETIHQRLVNQDTAVKTVVHAMIRARAEIRSQERPIGTFLFLGPTGVGKTETAKSLAESYFGSEEKMIRLDMSEFQGPDGVSRLIGSATNPVGRLTALIADHPFTVLLLDEFEKASPEVHQLFLQVFDEGRLTDAAGRGFSFLHAIIIATSNAGAELIRTSVKDGVVPEGFETTLKEHILGNNLLRPELLNRFDAVVTYSPLNKDHLRQISRLMLKKLNKRLDAEHGITVAITDELIDFLISIGYNPEFGARPMNRAIQDTVEFAIAQMVIKGEVHPGQAVQLSPDLLRTMQTK